MSLLLLWLVNAVSLLAVAHLIPGIEVKSFVTALIAALILGLVNTLVRPVLILLTLPVTILSLGLFIFVLNGVLFWFVGAMIEGFVVQTFTAGIIGAIVYSIISWILSALIPNT